jgi:Spy/CpxP family protein refolding chaperone
MKTTLTRLSFVASLSMAAALAQPPLNQGGAPPDPATMVARRVQMLTRFLNLSDAQAAQATTIFKQAANDMQSIRSGLQTAHETMRTAIKANDAGGITAAANNIGNLTGQELAIQGKADAAFYAILNTDQKAKYDQMGPGRMGPGGMGFGGPAGMRGAGAMRGRNPQQ